MAAAEAAEAAPRQRKGCQLVQVLLVLRGHSNVCPPRLELEFRQRRVCSCGRQSARVARLCRRQSANWPVASKRTPDLLLLETETPRANQLAPLHVETYKSRPFTNKGAAWLQLLNQSVNLRYNRRPNAANRPLEQRLRQLCRGRCLLTRPMHDNSGPSVAACKLQPAAEV